MSGLKKIWEMVIRTIGVDNFVVAVRWWAGLVVQHVHLAQFRNSKEILGDQYPANHYRLVFIYVFQFDLECTTVPLLRMYRQLFILFFCYWDVVFLDVLKLGRFVLGRFVGVP